MTARMRVALVFGGRSGEHEVSVISARSVAAALDRDRFVVVPMAIDRGGLWADTGTAAAVLAAPGTTPDTVPAFTGTHRIDPRLLAPGIGVVLPILHGPFGEDGTIQGLCEMLDLPYAGCGVTASGVTMDKALTKRLLCDAGLPTPRFVSFSAERWAEDRAACEASCAGLPLPWFVKPSRMGSSVGISKVKTAGGLAAAVDTALTYDDLVLVEEGIPAREIEVAVLEADPAIASVPGEIVPGHEFYDYADKYLDSDCQLLAPAPLAPAHTETVRALALAAFAACSCEGMARVDFLLDRRDGSFYVSELNTIPGFTSISMYPRLLALSGVAYPRLLATLIETGLARHRRRGALAAAALRPLAERVNRGE